MMEEKKNAVAIFAVIIDHVNGKWEEKGREEDGE